MTAMKGLWNLGSTPPYMRCYDLERQNPLLLLKQGPLPIPFSQWPAPDTLSVEQISDLTFNVVRAKTGGGFHGRPSDLIPKSERDRIAMCYGRPQWEDWNYELYPTLAVLYLSFSLQSPLPEDDIIDVTGSVIDNWPSQGDHLARRIYTWHIETVGWDNYVPKLVVRKLMQLQKWSAVQNRWVVYNQYGHNITFGYSPEKQAWSGGFDLQEWLDEHMSEIATAWNIIFSAVATIVSVGTLGWTAGLTTAGQIAALQAASRSLAVAAAGGDFGQIAAALVQVYTAIGNLPGMAEFGAQLKQAGAGAVADLVNQAPALKTILPVMAESYGQGKSLSDVIEKAIVQAYQFKAGIEKEIEQVKTAFVPPQLLPTFNQALSLGRAAASYRYSPSHPVPDYAKPTWDLGAAYGALSGRGPQKAARGVARGVTLDHGPSRFALVKVSPGVPSTRAKFELLEFVRKLEPKYGLSWLEKATRRAELKAQGYSDAQLAKMGY
jgi:hypothetical protein